MATADMNKQHSIKKTTQILIQCNTLPLHKVQPDREDSLTLPRVQKGMGNKKEINPDSYHVCLWDLHAG